MSTIFKAYAASAKGEKLKPFEFDPGPLGDEQVEIQVSHCGLCHSDLSMLENEWQMTHYPFVPGHEVIGTVVAAGHHARLAAFSLIGTEKSISGSPLGSPATLGKMLDFSARHRIAPKVQVFPMSQANEALDHLRAGQARYRVVLKNDY